MAELLFEIGTEELPPGLIKSLTDQIRVNLINELATKDITVSETDTKTFNTPRRIAIYIANLPQKQELKKIEIKGPDKSKAFDATGKPTQAGIGFAKKYNLEPNELEIKKVNNLEYVFAKTETGGKETINLLSEILPISIKQTTGEKFMKWGNNDEKFARPIKWILALLDNKVIKFNYANIESNYVSHGHRFLSTVPIKINSPGEYEKVLEQNHVIVCPEKRKEIIEKSIKEKTNLENGNPIIDPALLREVVNITGFPSSILCTFDKDFLSLPKCIIETVLKKHQRYFVLTNPKDKEKLLNSFIVITNGTESISEKNQEQIKKGNEKVVRARLSDAQFFYKDDLKTPFTYESRGKKLTSITFQKGLGSMEEKVKRVTKLSEFIYENLSKDSKLDITKDDITNTASLCKLDLTTHLVFEFTELEGEIGCIYAEANNFSEAVSKGILEHYYPRYLGDNHPKTTTGFIIGVADKIDNLTSLFSIGKIPTGSADPFALRRQAQGIIENILYKNINLNLTQILNHLVKNIADDKTRTNLTNEKIVLIKEFLIQRFITIMESKGFETDLIQAVTSLGEPLSDIITARSKIEIIKDAFISSRSKLFKPFLTAAKRLVRIVESDTNGNLDINHLKTEYEKSLLMKFNEIEKKGSLNYKEMLSEFITLTEPINKFFDNILVNDPDKKIKDTRQSLLKKGKDLFERICDFNKIQERN